MAIVQVTRTFDVDVPEGATHYYGTIKDEEADGVIWYKIKEIVDCAACDVVWSYWSKERQEWMFCSYNHAPPYIHEIKYEN